MWRGDHWRREHRRWWMRSRASTPVHSHTVFIATVVDVALRGERAKPLLYADGRFDALRSVTDPI
jgi:flavin reductase (DIM6/NTAB) family NADH-FMN oxidoreductase RutF